MYLNDSKAAALVLALVLSVWGVPAQGQLSALVFEEASNELRVVEIDSETGDVALGAVGASDCCRFLAGLTAADTQGERFFTVGEFTGGAGEDQLALFSLSFDGVSISAELLPTSPAFVLGYDADNDRLISMTAADLATGLQLVEIDPDTAVSTTIGTPNPDCCEVLTGISAIDAGAQILYFAGRLAGESNWSVYSADLTTGSIVEELALVAGTPGFMALNADTGFLEVLLQQSLAGSSQLIGVDLVGGGAVLLAEHASSDCCLLSPGQTASSSADGDAWWLAGGDTSFNASMIAISSIGTPGLSRVQAITAGYRMLAMVVNGETVSLDLVFRDRFQL